MLLAMAQNIFEMRDTITVAQTALTTDKSATLVDALATTKTAYILPANGTIALDMRFRGIGAAHGEVSILNLYAMRGVADHYTLIATLTVTTGTQLYSTGNRFIDTIVISNEKWPDDIVIVSDAADGIAHIGFNTHGYSNFVAIATTLGSASGVVVEASQE